MGPRPDSVSQPLPRTQSHQKKGKNAERTTPLYVLIHQYRAVYVDEENSHLKALALLQHYLGSLQKIKL